MFFIAVGVFSTQSSLFQIWEVLAFGLIGALLMYLEFSVAPILLGFVLGPMVEENFRRALLLSRGDLAVFVERPILHVRGDLGAAAGWRDVVGLAQSRAEEDGHPGAGIGTGGQRVS